MVSAMIVGLLLAAAMRTVGSSVFTQYRTGELVSAWSLADGFMAEVLAKDYKDPQGPPAFGPEPGEPPTSKVSFDDVDDFHNWTESPPQYADGTTMPDLSGWSRKVAVAWVAANNANDLSAAETGAKQITVSVLHNNVSVATRIAIRTDAP